MAGSGRSLLRLDKLTGGLSNAYRISSSITPYDRGISMGVEGGKMSAERGTIFFIGISFNQFDF